MNDHDSCMIFGWMVSRLGLTGSELIVYAVVFGFAQYKGGRFKGDSQYLADWCGCSVDEVQDIIDSLLRKGLLGVDDGLFIPEVEDGEE